jgi:hypothetical protein
MAERIRRGICECGCGQPTSISKANHWYNGYGKGRPMRFIVGHNLRKHTAPKHGQCKGGKSTPEYDAYKNAKARCKNPRHPSWPDYGGRGIEFRFTSFAEFYATLGPRPYGMSIERMNNNGHYEVGNVRWATRLEQTHNRRCSQPVDECDPDYLSPR